MVTSVPLLIFSLELFYVFQQLFFFFPERSVGYMLRADRMSLYVDDCVGGTASQWCKRLRLFGCDQRVVDGAPLPAGQGGAVCDAVCGLFFVARTPDPRPRRRHVIQASTVWTQTEHRDHWMHIEF